MSSSSLFSYLTDTNQSSSLFLKPCALFPSESSQFSSNSSNFSMFSQYFKGIPAIFPRKSCENRENAANLAKNAPTTVKVASNFETDRRFTLKLKEFPENCARKLDNCLEQRPETQGIRRKVEEIGVNFRNFPTKVCESSGNLRKKPENAQKLAKTVSFLRCERGNFKEKLSFRCFYEDQLNFPANLNKFLQNTENDDDVETDSETLEYYIRKVRRQLEEAVEEERKLKEMSRKKPVISEKENGISAKNKDFREKPKEIQGDCRENGLKLVVNQ